ncbi:MAG TPA: mechanosensitive ion channel protein MscS [Clostridiales bacterium]|nr:MAG: hypothetical protein A2Y18_04955 [Clostridiales bacterium GWD2_32_19]HCC06703.1 mechanosensitive ion channel protein MscS [Clostridiales bacterium]
MLENIQKYFNDYANTDVDNILILIGIVLGIYMIKDIFSFIVYRKTKDAKLGYAIKKFLSYITIFVGTAIFFYVYFRYYKYLGTLLGFFSAGLAIALREPILNIATWFYIFSTKPFEVGDRIKIGEYSGDVIDIRLSRFTLLEIGDWVESEQSTGRIIHVPNGRAILNEITNYTKGYKYIWDEISVTVTLDSDWKEAKYILNKIILKYTDHLSKKVRENIKQANKKYMISNFKYLTPVVYTKLEENGIKLIMRYLTKPRNRRTMQHRIWEEILEKFIGLENIKIVQKP